MYTPGIKLRLSGRLQMPVPTDPYTRESSKYACSHLYLLLDAHVFLSAVTRETGKHGCPNEHKCSDVHSF